MPSTYTLNNGIELIATGEQSGTWGDTTNTNLALIDTALDGQVTITLAAAGSSGSPNTLPISDGSTSNGRNRLVIFADGGDLGATAFVQLTPNDAEKIVYIRNSLSGGRSIILFQGTYNASNDYEVPAGTTAVVFFNGGGSGAVAANVFNNAHFDGLTVAGSAFFTAATTEGRSIEVGIGRSGDGFANVDLIGDATYSDYGARFFRNPGPNQESGIQHRGTGPLVLQSVDAGSIRFDTSGVDRMRVTAAGNVGIGNSAPGAKLAVVQDFNAGYAQTWDFFNGASFVFTNILAGDASNGAFFGPFQAVPLRFGTAAQERMRITAAGNVGIGTGAPGSKLQVESTNSTQITTVHNSSVGQSIFSVGVAAASTSWYHFNGVSGNNTVQNILILGNGNVQNANNSYGAFSDIKLKENVADATPKLADLLQVRVVNYSLKNTDQSVKQIGVIAQELEQTFPNMVEETVDRDKDGNDLGTTTKSVKYSVFVPMLIKALQEQQVMIDELKADVAALKGQ